ncbi:MAG TPA: transmembrane sensor/regulator PpyR, partial [Pseudomonas sp.]|nr:transmembrane sensor/regulator PpyR [Pseudomonas sp.]
ALVSMHAMTIIGPTLLKIGYVMRLLVQHRLGARRAGVVA